MPARPPDTLLKIFRDKESAAQIAVLAVEDGFEIDAMRVLSAWPNTPHVWIQPKEPCPEAYSAEAWSWLVSGWSIDINAVAEAAGVSFNVARKKIDVLVGNRIIYPDGSMAKFATAALTSHVASRLTSGKRKEEPKPKAKEAKAKARDDEDEDQVH